MWSANRQGSNGPLYGGVYIIAQQSQGVKSNAKGRGARPGRRGGLIGEEGDDRSELAFGAYSSIVSSDPSQDYDAWLLSGEDVGCHLVALVAALATE
jgi:hypothetical protein